MDMSLKNTGLSLSLGSGPTPPIITTHRPHNYPISFDASTLTLSLSDEPIISSPHSSVSSFSTAYPSTSVKKEEIEAEERGSSRASDEDEDGSARKKLRLTKDQSALLEDRFKEHSTLNPKQKQALAKQLNLRPRQVEVWFQNRRARTKLKQTEVEFEFLKQCCETLTDENRRLQKEVNELRTMKFVAAPLYMQLPAAMLAMCPSCQRVTAEDSKLHSFSPFTHSGAAC